MSQASGQSGCLSSIQLKEGLLLAMLLLFKASLTRHDGTLYTQHLGGRQVKLKFKASQCYTVKPGLNKQTQAKLAILFL